MLAATLVIQRSILAADDTSVPAASRVDELGDQRGPSGLVRGSDAAARVAVEVLVERDVVAEVRVALQLVVDPIDGTAAVLVAQEDLLQARRQRFRDAIERQHAAAARGTLHAEVVGLIVVEALQRLDDEV